MSRPLQDLRHAVRGLRRKRFVSGLAILAFALGIGVTTAVFSIFNSVTLTPLPFPESDRIGSVYDVQPACDTCPASFPKYHDWKSRNEVFAAIGGSSPERLILTGDGSPERVNAMSTTASLVDVFGVRPLLGRWYTEAEDQPGGPKVVVLSYGFWQSHFASDPSILGKPLRFDGDTYEVIGVMPRDFTHRRAEVYVPLQRAIDPATRGTHFLATFARLKPGVSVTQAATAMQTLGVALAREFGHNHGIDVKSYYEVVVGDVKTPLRFLLGAVFLVLMIACSNVANLLLAARSRFGSGLVVAEIALAFALLVGAGLLVKNLSLLQSRETGVRTAGAIAFDVAPAGARYESDAQVRAFYRDLYQRLTTIPGVQEVGLISHLPMRAYGMNGEVSIEGEAPWDAKDAPLVEYRFMLGEYLKSLEIPVLKGRGLDERDREGTRTVLINQTMADKFWPGQDPIGKRFGPA